MQAKYPGKMITAILQNEASEISTGELIGKIGTWQRVIDAENKGVNK